MNHCSHFQTYYSESNKWTCNNSNEIFHKFDHYGNANCGFTRVYASLSNKYQGIDFLATFSDSLSCDINSDSFNFKRKLLEALPIKVKQKQSAWWLFWWQCFPKAAASLLLYFDGFSVRIDFSRCPYMCTRRWRFLLPR